MLIISAPEGLSNTKLSSCEEIKEKLKGDNWNIEIRPREIYQKLAEHKIFLNFACSNKVLCKQLRPLFLTEAKEPKPFNKKQLKSKIDSLQDKISYTSPSDNNLLKFLANALIYKAFLLDAKGQIPQDNINKYKQKIGPGNIKKLEELEKKIEKYKKEFLNAQESFENKKIKISKINSPYYSNYEECNKLYQERKEKRKGYAKKGYDTAEENSKERLLYDESEKQFEAIYDDNTAYSTYKLSDQQYKEAEEKYNKALKDYESINGHEIFTEYKNLKEHATYRKYQKLDYKVSVHIRFARTMNALNAYTEENFNAENFNKHLEPYHETGISDEFARHIVKKRNLMKLARQKINRYVTMQNGGIYTTVHVDPDVKTPKRHHERTKFRYDDDKPIWDYSKHKDKKTYTLKERIKASCENFNKQIDKYVISTYANYYGVNNVLRVGEHKEDKEDMRLYLKYVYNPEKSEKKLEIPRFVDDEKNKEQEAPLHVLISGGEQFEKKIHNPEISGGFRYEPIPFDTRNAGGDDIVGLLYAIRKDKIAVSFTDTKEGFHSSMWSGKKVQAAGMLAAWNGKLIAVDNMSGHYKPNWYLTYMAWKPFYEKGVVRKDAILGKGVFHKDAILGISVATEVEGLTGTIGKSVSQYFRVHAFMKLAENDFEIDETMRELERHITELEYIEKNGGFNVTDQSGEKECKDVLMTPHVARYHRRWKDNEGTKLLARNFIMSMKYEWHKIIPHAIGCYRVFRGKKGKFRFWRFYGIEDIFKNRTKKVKKIITTCKKSIKNVNETIKLEEKRKCILKTATDNYKKVLSQIGNKFTSETDYEDLSEDEKKELYNLIKCITDIYYANRAYSILAASEGGYDKDIIKYQKKIGEWVSLLEPILHVKADRKAGLDIDKVSKDHGISKGDIYLSKEEQKQATENEEKQIDTFDEGFVKISDTEELLIIKDKDGRSMFSPEEIKMLSLKKDPSKEKSIGQSVVDSQKEVRTKYLRLVDKGIYEPQQPKKKEPPKSYQPKTTPQKQSQSGGGERFRCNDCGKEVVIYDVSKKHICPECGHMGCLDPKKKI